MDEVTNQEQQGAEETKAQETKQETKQDENMIPKSRFDEINSKYKEMSKQLEELSNAKSQAEAQRQAKEKEEAEKRGEFEKLYRAKEEEVGKLSTFKERAEALEGVITEMVDTKLKAIPKDYHDLIPENLSAEQKLSWINKAESKGMFKVEDKSEKTIGEPTNRGNGTKRDTSKMSAMEKLLMGYGKR
jgi:chromosome segregation ATPase